MDLLIEITLRVLTLAVKIGDQIALLLDRLEPEEEHPFLRDDPRPFQWRGRPRKDVF